MGITVCVQARCFILGFRSTFVCQKYCNKDIKITNRNLYCNIFSSRNLERDNQLMKPLSAQNKTSCLHAVSGWFDTVGLANRFQVSTGSTCIWCALACALSCGLWSVLIACVACKSERKKEGYLQLASGFAASSSSVCRSVN